MQDIKKVNKSEELSVSHKTTDLSKVYITTYRLDKVVVIPAYIAETIEDHVNRKVKFKLRYKDGTGGFIRDEVFETPEQARSAVPLVEEI